jgi:hypothetical protein
MRSVIVLMNAATKESVASHLDSVYRCQLELLRWVDDVRDPVLYISFYENLEKEAEPEELARLRQAIGGNVSVGVIADVSGRHDGRVEAMRFALGLLDRFGGIALDDYGAHAWIAEELRRDGPVEGRPFFKSEA